MPEIHETNGIAWVKPHPDLVDAKLASRAAALSVINDAYCHLDALAAVIADRDQARQKLADAPHTDICYYRQRQGDGCNCWKEEA